MLMAIGNTRLMNYFRGLPLKRRAIIRNILLSVLLWALCMLIIRTINPGLSEFLMFIGVYLPCGFTFYTYSFYWLIPKATKYRYAFWRYLLRSIGVMAAALLPFFMLALLFMNDTDAAFTYAFVNCFFQLFVTVPLSWYWYKRQVKGDEAITSLKKELRRSSASFDFLRSQINPHFLFNALNTIYGTAIQEKAERTSEGIEKLADMMRFMLQENMQEKISLDRELSYLDNYIALQKLRTDPTPSIRIETSIAHTSKNLRIAPMLLIPFVENAFKHGISFREPSYIKVVLEIADNTLYFDVSNSRHPGRESDPEKDKKGIGLDNVKHRLALFYPGRHELIIRETAKEFYVHFTITLD